MERIRAGSLIPQVPILHRFVSHAEPIREDESRRMRKIGYEVNRRSSSTCGDRSSQQQKSNNCVVQWYPIQYPDRTSIEVDTHLVSLLYSCQIFQARNNAPFPYVHPLRQRLTQPGSLPLHYLRQTPTKVHISPCVR